MSLIVVGSIALDSIETPFRKAEDVLGGSATYFSHSASFFHPVRVVAVVGEDFPQEYMQILKEKDIDTEGIVQKKGKTFRWSGRYEKDLNVRTTLDIQLNVFEDFEPVIPEKYLNTDYVFLANINPELQSDVLTKVGRHRLSALDTIDLWIDTKKQELKKVTRDVDFMIINDSEARMLGGDFNIVKSAKNILSWGLEYLIVKRGEYGVIMFGHDSTFFAPAYPLDEVRDPTGAGDVFAGGFMGYLADAADLSERSLRRGIVMGSVMASFCVEALGVERLRTLTIQEISKRFDEFKGFTDFS